MYTLDQRPFELLPLILDHVQRKDLLTCTLVNKRFYKAALPLLWRELYIPSDKVRDMIITILSTSSSAPGHHVRLLDKSVFCPISDAHLLAIIKHVPYLEKLDIVDARDISDASLQQVPNYCPHLTSINLSCKFNFGNNLEITDASMIALAQHCHQLTHLTLVNMRQITDASIIALPRQCHQLTHLKLIKMHGITNASMLALGQHCHQLTHLTLVSMYQITDASMIALDRQCHQLTHLKLINMHGITNASMLALGQHCHQLTHLTLRYMPSLDYATLLDHFHNCPLTHIEIFSPTTEPSERQPLVGSAMLGFHRHHQQTLTSFYIDELGDDILATILTHQLVWPRLTSFHVAHCNTLTDAMATTFMRTHPKLRNLTLSGSHYLTNHFLDNVIRFLPNLQSLNVAQNPQLTASGICRLIKHYNGQLVREIDCWKCDIYTDDEDFPEDLDYIRYENVYDEDDNNPEVVSFYASRYK